MNYGLAILQLVRLKRRPTVADVAVGVGLTPEEVGEAIQDFLRTGDLEETSGRVRLTARGRETLGELIAQERLEIDEKRLAAAYERFGCVNTEFKQLVTDWQMLDSSHPNDHTNADYDASVISRLADLHDQFMPLLGEIGAISPRLANYSQRFAAALLKVCAGEHAWVAGPLVDSYHTAWFELHEDLLGLAGLSRFEEAKAGRAE